MKRYLTYGILAIVVALSSACTRIETGEVGLRIGYDRQVSGNELLPGSFNQTIIGEVLTFPVKQVNVKIDDLKPIAKDNSTMKDFDLTVIYDINPSAVSDIWITKNRGFHASEHGEIYLMYNYILNAARNAVYKSARKYEALEMNDARPAIEEEVKAIMVKTLADEGLNNKLGISQVLVRTILPADTVVASANDLVRAKNELKQKEVEVKTAEAEARRIAALNANKGAVEYMSAMALLNISEGIKNGKVNTIVVPANFNSLMLGNHK